MKSPNPHEILIKLGVRPSKNLGQNFLIDPKIINAQMKFANLSKKDTVLEIGAGLGTLTLALASAVRKVIAIEKDLRFVGYLKTILPENVEVIEGDALELDWPEFDKIVANLPYQISSPLTFKLTDQKFQSATLMYQLEFADRIVAMQGSKKYGRLTVNLNYHFESRILMEVNKKSFYPLPKVDSAIVQLVPRKAPFEVRDKDLFFKLVNVVFNQRRKKIRNSLKNKSHVFNLPGDKFNNLLKEIPYQNNRPEDLSPQQLADLANMMAEII
jgi:16S rRNA (adenine1518-N6/adenine1519-N6)-dimethyltransferase